MTIRGNPPREREHGEHWKYIGNHGEKGWYGFSAGRPIGLDTHPSVLGPRPRTKPCLVELTKGKLSCPWCGKMPRGWHCYIPLWRELDSRPVIVVTGQDMWERASQLEHLALVSVSRGLQKSDGTVIHSHSYRREFVTALARRREPQDITNALLVLWAIPELTRWYLANGTSDNAVSQPATGSAPATAETPKPARPVIDENDPAVIELRRVAALNRKPAGELSSVEAVEVGRTVDYVLAGVPAAAKMHNGHQGDKPRRKPKRE